MKAVSMISGNLGRIALLLPVTREISLSGKQVLNSSHNQKKLHHWVFQFDKYNSMNNAITQHSDRQIEHREFMEEFFPW